MSLLRRNDALLSKLVHYLLVFLGHSEHLHLPPVSPIEGLCLFLAGLICSLQGHQPQSDRRAICSLCLLLAHTTVLIGMFCLRGCKRTMSRFSLSVCTLLPTPGVHLSQMDPGSYLKWAHGNICLRIPITFLTWRGASDGPQLSYFDVALRFR